jgi:hypothetical protein
MSRLGPGSTTPFVILIGLVVACSSSNDDAAGTGGANANGASSSGSSSGAANGGGNSTSSGGASSSGAAPGGASSSGEVKASPRPGCKRGVAYGHHSEADLRALSKGISWWYNWTFEPDAKVRTIFGSLNVEYIPMVWGTKVSTTQVQEHVLPSSSTLLGFNEPNFFEQANLSATAAAAAWPSVQAVADAKGLKLVSPAVNFCGGGCHDGSPFDYLDDFFAACPDCRVDVLGVHIYVGCKGENGNHAQWLINHLKTYEARFTKPIWLTEFACNDAKNEDEQRAFLVDAITYLESDPRIERYAWFAGRADNVPHVDLLGADGELTALGHAYVDAPHNGACSN